MGCIAVQALAGDDRVDEVVIADINTKQAKTVADTIKSKKIKTVAIDLNKKDEFVQVLKGAGTCLNATTFYTNLLVMDAWPGCTTLIWAVYSTQPGSSWN